MRLLGIENERAALNTTVSANSTASATQTDDTSTVVIPYNAPTASSFEQALTQAGTPQTTTSTAALPGSASATTTPQPVTPSGGATSASSGATSAQPSVTPAMMPGYGYYMMPGLAGSPTTTTGGTTAGMTGMMPVAMMPMAYMLVPVAAGMYGGMPFAAAGSAPATATPGTAVAAGAATTAPTGVGGGSAALQMPFSGTVSITQGFGPTSFSSEPPYEGYAHFHTGIDFGVPSGTAIDAAAGGTVVAAGWDNTGFGNRVIIDHGNGLQTLYAHLEQVNVTPGMQVAAGQEIGLSGSTGNSTGPHLHFGVKLNNQWVDPTPYLQPGGSTASLTGPTMQSPGVGGADEAGDAKDIGGTASPLLQMESASAANPPAYGLVFAPVPVVASGAASATSATLTTQRQPATQAQQGSTQPIFRTAPASPAVAPPPVVAASVTTSAPASSAPAAVPATATSGGGVTAMVQQAAEATGVPASLIQAVMQAESSGNPRAESPSGAKGLMQLMDATATAYGVTDSFDPQQSLLGGARFLRDLLHQFQGNTSLAIAAYNAGPGAVTKYGGIPPYPETKAYVARVLQLQQQYAAQGA